MEAAAAPPKPVCTLCAAGHKPTRRKSTGEWVHTRAIGGMWSQAYCVESDARNLETQ